MNGLQSNPRFAMTTVLIIGIIFLSVINFQHQVLASRPMHVNQTNRLATGNMTFVGNMIHGKNMTMPGGNMTFVSSLQNAKMHLAEAILDLKAGNTKGVAMELNLTSQNIKMHEQELKVMMMQVKNMMARNMREK